ncbi:uncharacterized protein I303_104663 [Kwoniella dejecticola CBS 10117]|uniref:MICOS complex subunit n=1 Tax=Kwoniella dejecticola CBS 10117 TaxID=1296121 RepID=A0A1A6A4P9_9TREE|nr:uncharacterized protein I303_04357 [Kwoniella dejecticola CBS 10117]OBR85030.1 hypothetical protein I303_04357 [Kwoniella dejecticola CBS 10117]
MAAQGEGSVRPGRGISGDKLPIYPTSESNPLITLVEKPNPLVPYIAQTREAVTGVLGDARGYLQSGVGSWIGFERRVEKEVKSILPPDEPLNPGLIYILVSGLSGSVLTRTRSLPIRFLAPPLFTLAAFPYFLPKTSSNIRKYLSDIEDKNFPEFAARHDRFVSTGLAHTQMTIDRIKDYGSDVKSYTAKGLDSLEKNTGLQFNQNLNTHSQTHTPRATQTSRVQEELSKAAPAQYERVGYVVEQKPVAEVVVPVTPKEEKKLV